MKFKDNQLIWEAYQNPGAFYDDEETQLGDGLPELDPMGDPSAVVMEFDPIDEVEPIESESDLDIAVYTEIKKLAEYSKRILTICQEKELDPWMQAQLVKAASYVSDVWHMIDAKADFANTGFEHADNLKL